MAELDRSRQLTNELESKMNQVDSERRDLEEAQRRAEEAQREAERSALLEKEERERKVSTKDVAIMTVGDISVWKSC